MSIVINNISDTYSRTAVQKYEVRINRIPLAYFEHNSEDGMSKCLELASQVLIGVDIDAKIAEHKQSVQDELIKYLRGKQNG